MREQYWLINAFLADMQVGAVKAALQFDQVQFVQLEEAGEKPPADANPNNDVIDGLGRIQSRPYSTLAGMGGGFVGLLDTGVRTSHTTFAASGGDHIDFLRDCVSGGTTCNDTSARGFNTDDNCESRHFDRQHLHGNANRASTSRAGPRSRSIAGRSTRPRVSTARQCAASSAASRFRPRVHR